MNDFENLLKGINPDVLKQIQSFAKSDDGKKLMDKFKDVDKEKLLKNVGKMSDADKSAMLKNLNQTPDVINKIKGMK